MSGGLGSDMGSMLERREKKNAKEAASQEGLTSSTRADVDLVRELYEKNKNQPRISFWDLESKVVLNYLKETKPKFSISKEISRVLQEYLENEYPDIWSEVKDLSEK